MATDYVKLFNKTLADQLLTTGQDPLLAFGDETIYLDYWGCYVEVFSQEPDGSISSLKYFPDDEEELFLLLRPENVTQMIDSLRAHYDDLRVMTESEIEQLEKWRDFCVADPSYMVAYLFDF